MKPLIDPARQRACDLASESFDLAASCPARTYPSSWFVTENLLKNLHLLISQLLRHIDAGQILAQLICSRCSNQNRRDILILQAPRQRQLRRRATLLLSESHQATDNLEFSPFSTLLNILKQPIIAILCRP